MSSFTKLFMTLVMLTLVFGGLTVSIMQADRVMAKTLTAEADAALIIEPKQSFLDTAALLEQRQLIPSRYWLLVYAVKQPHVLRLRAGEYKLESGMSVADLLNKMQHGQVWLHPVTLVEGMTIHGIRQYLNRLSFLENDIGDVSDSGLVKILKVNPRWQVSSLEGLLAADTFKVPLHTKQSTLLNDALALNDKRVEQIWEGRDDGLGLESAYQALILASLIERETANPAERSIISSVFYNRLHINMPLQTDPTIIYALGERYDGHLHHADLSVDSPYNTYLHVGLPPSPIGLVGKASLQAAVHPAASDYLYFVASGENDGRHHFSATLKEHEVRVKQYIEAKGHP